MCYSYIRRLCLSENAFNNSFDIIFINFKLLNKGFKMVYKIVLLLVFSHSFLFGVSESFEIENTIVNPTVKKGRKYVKKGIPIIRLSILAIGVMNPPLVARAVTF